MENIQQAAKPSAMMNEAPMNHLTLSDRLKSYKRTPGSFLVMLLVVLSAVATIAALVFLILYILVMVSRILMQIYFPGHILQKTVR